MSNSSNNPANATNIIQRVASDSWFIFTVLVSFSGSLLLVLLLLTSFRRRELRSGARVLIIHLMVMQLLICSVLSPVQTIATYETLLAHHIRLDCPPLQLLQIGTMYAENWASTLLAVNRYVAVVIPHHYQRMLTKQVLTLMITLPWLMGIGITAPLLFGIGGLFVWAPEAGICYPRSTGGPYGTVLVAVGAYTPLVLIGVCYMTLFVRIGVGRRSNMIGLAWTASGGVANVRTRKARRRQISMTNMLVVMFLWHCLCFLPSPILSTTFPQVFTGNFMLQLWVTKTLVICGYAVSPVIFLAISLDYQRVCSTNLTVISLSFGEGTNRDEFFHMNPAYDLAIKHIQGMDSVVFRNFTHIPVRCFNDSLTVGNFAPIPPVSTKDIATDDDTDPSNVASACFFRFYHLHPELFIGNMSKEFIIVTTPTFSEAGMEMASFMAAIDTLFVVSVPSNKIANVAAYPTTLNFFAMPDDSFPIGFAVMAKRFGWSGVNVVCDPRGLFTFIGFQCLGFGFYIQSPKNTVFRSLPYDVFNISVSDNGNWTDFSRVLTSIRGRRAALVLLEPNLVREFMIAAHFENLTTGEYVFVTFAVTGIPSENEIFWKTGDSNDEVFNRITCRFSAVDLI
ncbi:hypothetical protein BV898_09119 [Hypsibius exemplaris]|uniref:G-protein coupled receptors family 1 profile domain-containing protein n=1 Tax=Hypsibius exemplaris TaxID=2072580 RepID=A0A1W0WNL7_HYPEX|nr:hypothetical protein BV898_09119 [Hypsibius exemplaris]